MPVHSPDPEPWRRTQQHRCRFDRRPAAKWSPLEKGHHAALGSRPQRLLFDGEGVKDAEHLSAAAQSRL